MIYLSASSIADYIKCPQKVLYRRTKPFPEVPSKGMIVGRIAHLAIEKAWSNKDKAYSIIHQEAKTEKLAKAEITNLEFFIDIFFLNFREKLGNNDLIEYNFKFKMFDDVFLVGKIDRISNGNLYDWKTQSIIKGSLHNDVQCIIYDYAYTTIFDKKPNSICLASLAKGTLTPYIENKMYVRELFERIIPKMIKTIKNESWDKSGMFNGSCFNCPYKTGCLGGVEEYVVDNTVSPE